MPQESNRTGLQTVHREEGRVQPGRAAKENGKEGGEGGGKATGIVGAGSRQYSVVARTGGTGFANSDQYGFDGEVSDGSG